MLAILQAIRASGSVSKFIVSVLGAVVVVLGIYFGTQLWEPSVVAVLTALAVFLVPNTPNNN